jgi:glycosyltransferase 2 family protein
MRSQAGVTVPVPPRARDAGTAPRRARRIAQVFHVIALIVGAIALGWMIRSVGPERLVQVVTQVGWWFVAIVALDVIAVCLDAAALRTFMRPESRMVSYPRVLAAQAGGRAINVLTPLGTLGEPVKLAMLVGHAPRARVLSAILLLNLGMLYLSVIAIAIGTPILFLLVDIPRAVAVAIGLGLALLLPVVVAVGMLVHRGAVATVVNTIRRTGVISEARADRWRLRLGETDRHIRALHHERSHGAWKGLGWLLASRGVSWLATLALLHAAGVELSWALAVGLISAGVLIKWASQIVPMGLGLAEGGNYALYALIGVGGAYGMAMTLLNRARSVAVALPGLLAMVVVHLADRLATARTQRALEHLRDRAIRRERLAHGHR